MSYSIEKLVFYLRGLFSAPIICELSKRKVFTYTKNKANFNLKAVNKIIKFVLALFFVFISIDILYILHINNLMTNDF